jgi:8-oxo-dGTP pyrophosphatase MutT (NUDIX family)
MLTKKGPWTVINTKHIYKNPWINVREDKVIRPDGKEGIFGVVSIKPGVAVLPIDNEGNVFLIEQFRYVMNKKTIEVVSGGIENNENTLDAAKRELKEETGIEAKEWTNLGVINPLTAVIDSQSYLFLAKNLNFSDANHDGTENIKLIKVSLDQAVDWVRDGLITNSVTITLILKAKIYKKGDVLSQ